MTSSREQRHLENSEVARTAVIYARVSSKEQEREGYSIPAQLKLLRDYADEHGFSIKHEFTDVETAKQVGRTHFNEMVTFLKDQSSNCIILVEKTDRLYRNLCDWVTLDDLEVEVHLVKENCILSKDSKSAEKFMHGIRVLMARNYVLNLGEETRKGMTEKAAQGIWPSRAPIGYINVECQGKRFIQPDPVMAPVVLRLFELYSTGRYSLHEVTNKIREEGLAYRKSGNRIEKSLVHKMLTNPIYYGDFEWDGKFYKGVHDPIVSKSLWDQVQTVLYDKGQHRKRNGKYNWLFQGLLFCGHCGCALTAELKKSKYVYYHCTGHKGKCPEKFVREEELIRQFGEALDVMKLDEDVMKWLVTALKSSHQHKKDYHNEAIVSLRQHYNRIQSRLDAMYEDRLDGKISEEMYDRKSEEWRREQIDIMRKLESHQTANRAYLEDGVQILELAKHASVLYGKQDPAEKRRVLETVFSNSIWIGGTLYPSYREPYNLIVEAQRNVVDNYGGEFDKEARNENWLPELDSNQ